MEAVGDKAAVLPFTCTVGMQVAELQLAAPSAVTARHDVIHRNLVLCHDKRSLSTMQKKSERPGGCFAAEMAQRDAPIQLASFPLAPLNDLPVPPVLPPRPPDPI